MLAPLIFTHVLKLYYGKEWRSTGFFWFSGTCYNRMATSETVNWEFSFFPGKRDLHASVSRRRDPTWNGEGRRLGLFCLCCMVFCGARRQQCVSSKEADKENKGKHGV